jgi:VAD1 Analog of StAR-related lipid transfer domain/GRAM domain
LHDAALVEEPGEKTPSPKKTAQRQPVAIVTAVPATPPNVNNGPTTYVTPPTPTGPRESDNPQTETVQVPSDAPIDTLVTTDVAPAQNKSLHYHSKSAPTVPSRLANQLPTPLTPALEEVKTPGGTLTAPQATSGFFSSMFSAAQNAATSLTNTIASTTVQRSRSGTNPASETEKSGEAGGEEVILSAPEQQTQARPKTPGERKPLAIETIGSGNLSLSHLGISESADPSSMTSKVDVTATPQLRSDEISAKAEDDAAARAVSLAYSETAAERPASSATPTPTTEQARVEEQTPVRPPTEPETSSIKRAGSVRSRLSGRRRTRGSSAATGTTTVAASAIGTGLKINGFAFANNKRNEGFHNLFKSVPTEDRLIEDYSAALQREILLQGRLYISEGHVCFSSNILGWVTTLVISFDEIISIEKKSTAVFFQNGIVIQTLHARNVFASLLNRDGTYELIVNIWKVSHPNLKSSLNGNPVEDAKVGDKTEKAESVVDDDSASEEVYDEDEEESHDEDGDGSFVEAGEGSLGGSDVGEAVRDVSRKTSAAVVGAPVSGGNAKVIDSVETVLTGATANLDFPGPATHDPTDCGDAASHHDKLLTDTTIPAPLGKVYSMMFGPASGAFMKKFLAEDQKCFELQLEDDKKGLGGEKKSRSYSYIKPLNGAIGPKQTKCMITETLEQDSLTKAVTIACSTQNPDVPNGNIFLVKTRYCLMWGPANSTRLIITCTIEWSGKSWLKGMSFEHRGYL